MLIHLAEQQAALHGNPASSWNYQDEGEIGIAAKMAESVHIRTLPTAAMEKYLVLQGLVL